MSNSLRYLSMALSVADNGGDASLCSIAARCFLDDRNMSLADKSHLEARIKDVGNQDVRAVMIPAF